MNHRARSVRFQRAAGMFREDITKNFLVTIEDSVTSRIRPGKFYQYGELRGTITNSPVTIELNNLEGDVTFISSAALSASTAYDVYIAGENIGALEAGIFNDRSLIIPITWFFPAVAATVSPVPSTTTQTPAAQKPRYIVKSPVINGAYTESVRELSPELISRLRSQGYQITSTNHALAPAIKVLGNPSITTYDARQRVARRGFVDRYVPVSRSDILRTVMQTGGFIPKSEYNPRRIFAEPRQFSQTGFTPRYTFEIQSQSGRWSQIGPVSIRAYEQYRRNYPMRNLRITNEYTDGRTENIDVPNQGGAGYTYSAAPEPAQNPNRLTPEPDSSVRYTYRIAYPSGLTVYRNNVSHMIYSSDRSGSGSITNIREIRNQNGPITYVNPQQQTQQQDSRIQSLQAELKNLRAWLTEVNSRLSGQAVDLGQSDVDRSAQINQLREWTQQQYQRINRQLSDLGNAISDASKAIEIQKSENLVNSLKGETQASAWDEITKSWQGISTGIGNVASKFTWENIKTGGAVILVGILLIMMAKYGIKKAL